MKNKDKVSFSNIKDRLKCETPPFWKKIRNVCITIGAVSAAVIAGTASLPIVLPAIVGTLAGYGVAVGVFGASLASLTKTDAPEK